MKYLNRGAAVLVTALLLSGCAQYENKRGVFDSWEDGSDAGFVVGETTRRDVLKRLGPPSQVIALGDETVLYYLYERAEGKGLILIVYNQFELDTRYDRAIFFFDAQDRLTDQASYFATGDGR